MICDWREKTGLYVDGELEPAAQQAFITHLESCDGCAAAVLEQQELKRAVRIAGKRFTAPPELYAQIRMQTHTAKTKTPRPWWTWGFAAATLVLLVALSSVLIRNNRPNPTIAGLVDQHITTLASVHPVDVISEDRHTVKPWFEGKLPFTFNLPELKGTPYTLEGGKVAYIEQSPGAELLYDVGQHKTTVFIFKASGAEPAEPKHGGNSTFTVKSWREGELQFYMITDASDYESSRLVSMLQEANR
jgi:anti-sigma factor RsiW